MQMASSEKILDIGPDRTQTGSTNVTAQPTRKPFIHNRPQQELGEPILGDALVADA
jgi:hypothetical protein